ncbi:MAG: hypothetical protein C4308_06500 [Chitinophagaceae bacterium]
MKKYFALSLLVISIVCTAQDTTKVEQYCKLVATGRPFSTKVTIDIDFGEERKLFGPDTRLKDEASGKLKKFNSVIDALNYMGFLGWTLVNAFPITEGSTNVYHFFFKKLYTKEEVRKNE